MKSLTVEGRKKVDSSECLQVAVFASKKVRPAFTLLEESRSVRIYFSDWSLSPRIFFKNILLMNRADIVYFHSPANLRVLMMPIARLLRKPVMLQWIGGDVLTVAWKTMPPFWDIGAERRVSVEEALLKGLSGLARVLVSSTMKKRGFFIAYLKKFTTRHVACAPHLVHELRNVGVSAHYLPILNHIRPELLPFPDNFAVLSYIGYHASVDTRLFYGWTSILRLAADFPSLTIYVVGRGTELGGHPGNIIFLGYVDDIRAALLKVKAVLRLTYHDGMPRMILEGLATGRYVVCSQTLPCTMQVRTYQELRNAVEFIKHAGNPNIPGLEYVRSVYDHERVADRYMKEFFKTQGDENKD